MRDAAQLRKYLSGGGFDTLVNAVLILELDTHSSPEFLSYCEEKNIILLFSNICIGSLVYLAGEMGEVL